jgi:ribose-phosphate pyrophosphokinase
MMSPVIFGMGESRDFALSICRSLSVSLGSVHEEWRPDGEPWCAALDNVRGSDVYVVSSLYGSRHHSVSEKTLQIMLFVDALKRASADRVTAVCPYLSFGRQDRKENSREPVSTQALAKMMEVVGVDRVLTMDAHNPAALQNAFRIPIDILEARKPMADAVADFIFHHFDDFWEFTVLSPDAGGVKRAKIFQASLAKRLGNAVGFAHAHKTRMGAGDVRVEIIGDVRGKNVLVVDDVVSTAGTIREITRAVVEAKGIPWGVVATHWLSVGQACKNLIGSGHSFMADTIPPGCPGYPQIAHMAPMFAEAIRRIHSGTGSISELLDD